jgi:ectoine hydroxylase
MGTILEGKRDSASSQYLAKGWYQTDERLAPSLLARVRDRVDRMSGQVRPEVVYEEDSDIVRAIHGCHRYDDLCADLVRHPLLLDIAESFTGGPVYVYQFKVNVKQPREGREWPWHQDFAFWHNEDGMRNPDAVNLAVFLDDVHHDNGPLTALSGSHRLGLLPSGHEDEPVHGRDWHEHVSAKLTYTVAPDRAEELAAEFPKHCFTGPAGTVVAFHPSIVHASTNNYSESRRAILIVTYNSVRNAPRQVTRPAFLVDPDTTPVTRLGAAPVRA